MSIRKWGWRAIVLLAACGLSSPALGVRDALDLGLGGREAASAQTRPAPRSRCRIPTGWLRERAGTGDRMEPIRNEVTVDPAGRIYWNHVEISFIRLGQYLQMTASRSGATPLLEVAADPRAPCGQLVRIFGLAEGMLECSELCRFSVRAFDHGQVRDPPPAAEFTVLAALRPSEARPARRDTGCGEINRNVTLRSASEWSPWIELNPGCQVAVVVAPDDMFLRSKVDGEVYIRQCRWQGALTANCDRADAVRFRLEVSMESRGEIIRLHLRVGRP